MKKHYYEHKLATIHLQLINPIDVLIRRPFHRHRSPTRILAVLTRIMNIAWRLRAKAKADLLAQRIKGQPLHCPSSQRRIEVYYGK